LGYRPEDDAEVFAEEVLSDRAPLSEDDADVRFVGGRAADAGGMVKERT
jgi:hypothetical protein